MDISKLQSSIVAFTTLDAPIEQPLQAPAWNLYVDGSSNINGSKVGILLISLNEQVFEYRVRFEFLAINNVSEYKAIMVRLCLAEALNAYHMQVHSDSQLMMDQCQRINEAKEPTMQLYL